MNKMEDTKHNGWTNYATWKVNLDIVRKIQFDEPITAEEVAHIVESTLFDGHTTSSSYVESYARAFIDQVDYSEIADAINFDFEDCIDYFEDKKIKI